MDSYKQGIKQLVLMLGEEKANTIIDKFENLSPTFSQEAISVVFGRTWSREQLDLKTRSLCSICILAALGRVNALKINFTLAIENGASSEEIIEALLQVAIYAGYPAALDAVIILHEVMAAHNT